MLRTMSSLCVPNFDSAPLSMPKLEPIFHFPQVNALISGLKLLDASHFISLRQHERTHIFVYSYFKKRLSERMVNRGCATERNCGYAIWYHNLRSPCMKMTTLTMSVCLRVLACEDKRNTRFFQLTDVPRFLVTTAYCLRPYSPVTRNLEM